MYWLRSWHTNSHPHQLHLWLWRMLSIASSWPAVLRRPRTRNVCLSSRQDSAAAPLMISTHSEPLSAGFGC